MVGVRYDERQAQGRSLGVKQIQEGERVDTARNSDDRHSGRREAAGARNVSVKALKQRHID